MRGWYPGRNVLEQLSLPIDYPVFPMALRVLAEFGGIEVGEMGPGINMGSSIITFDPTEREGTYERLRGEHPKRIYPIAMVDHGHALLFVDEEGSILYYAGKLELINTDIWEALTSLVLGL
jgi:hypothetical protein